MITAQCLCGFAELADEEVMDHLFAVFEPDDSTGKDGQVHEELAGLTCSCGSTAVTAGELEDHFMKAFTPGDAVGRDNKRHGPPLPGRYSDSAVLLTGDAR